MQGWNVMDRHCTWKVRAEGGMARRRAWLLSALLVLGMTSAAQAAARPELSLGLRYGEGAVYGDHEDRKSTRLNSSHVKISYAVFCLKKKTQAHPSNLRRAAPT